MSNDALKEAERLLGEMEDELANRTADRDEARAMIDEARAAIKKTRTYRGMDETIESVLELIDELEMALEESSAAVPALTTIREKWSALL